MGGESRWLDLRYGARLLRRNPGFAAIAVLTLGLGVGAAVGITSAAYTVLYRPLSIDDPDSLVVPVSTNLARSIERGSVPFADYVDWRSESDVFEQVALFNPVQADISGAAAPERVDGLQVSAEYFPLMRVRPLLGRPLIREDHEPEAERVLVISEGLWRQRYGADPAIVGKTIRLAGNATRVVGVVPADAVWPENVSVWLPMRPALFGDDIRTRRDNMIFLSVARLGSGVPIEQGRARVKAVAERVAREHPESRGGWSTDLVPLREYIVDPEVRVGMLAVMGGVGFLLLIACVNLANLLLARGADRAREMALRSALGASRRRLLQQMITESLLLATAGGLLGLAVSHWILEGLKAGADENLPMREHLALNEVTLVLAIAVTLLSALIFGVFPALTVSALRPADALREAGRAGGAGRATGRTRDLLVVAQLALAVVLLVGAGLMLRSLSELLLVNPGVDVERIIAGRVVLPSARYADAERRVGFYERLTEALAASPGVEAAAATSFLPAGGLGFGLGRVFLLEGQAEPPASTDHPASWNVVTRDYFRTLGIPLLRGRTFTPEDTAGSRPVMIINQTMARRVFGDQDPLGRRMRSWRDENVLREIVGVVADVRYYGLADDERSLVYVPHQQNAWGSMTVAIRARSHPSGFADTLRREVSRLDADVAVARLRTLSSMAAESISPQRFGAVLLALFAAAAAVLAGIGVYGVMSYAVTQRRHEFGVRLALGASPAELQKMILRRGLALAASGAILGLAGGVAVGPLIGDLLFQVPPADPLTLTVVPFLLTIVALVACALPGRRAARVEPLEALRE